MPGVNAYQSSRQACWEKLHEALASQTRKLCTPFAQSRWLRLSKGKRVLPTAGGGQFAPAHHAIMIPESILAAMAKPCCSRKCSSLALQMLFLLIIFSNFSSLQLPTRSLVSVRLARTAAAACFASEDCGD